MSGDLEPLDVEVVNAEVVHDPCQCVCGDCQNERHCDRASCAQPDGVIAPGGDDTALYTFNEAAATLDVQAVPVPVRMLPQGNECWWRLYSTPTSMMRSHQDHGVLAVYAHRHNPHTLVLHLVGNLRLELSVLAWRVNNTDPARTDNPELGTGKAAPPAKPGPDSIDLLVAFPPALPGARRHWQQMTQPGQLRHPGDNREHWQFAEWWQGGEGVRFEDGETWPPADSGTTAIPRRRNSNPAKGLANKEDSGG